MSRYLALMPLVALLPACELERHFTVLGYTTEPQYVREVNGHALRTVHVPIFQNMTLRRGLEFDVTRAVVREIEAKTPYKVVSNCEEADSELLGRIINRGKNILNRNQLNEVREAETYLTVEVVWRDRHTGEILSLPRNGQGVPPPMLGGPPPLPTPGGAAPATPQVPPEGGVSPAVPPPGVTLPVVPPVPVLVTSLGTFIPEVGESLTTAEKKNVDRLAVQIVSMMEKPW